MIIVTRPAVSDAELDHIRERIETLGMRTHLSRGEQRTIIGCIGDESLLQEAALLSLPGVESVHPVLKPYKLASLEFVARPTVIRVGNASIGGRELVVAPVDRRLDGVESRVSAVEQAVRRQDAKERRGKLDRKRQAVETGHEAGDGGRRPGGDRDVGTGPPRPIDEERHGRAERDGARLPASAAGGVGRGAGAAVRGGSCRGAGFARRW